MPPRKATGTKMAASTKVVATTGPVICCIARLVASRADIPGLSSMIRRTFSTTTMESSTTSVTASTTANKEIVFAE